MSTKSAKKIITTLCLSHNSMIVLVMALHTIKIRGVTT